MSRLPSQRSARKLPGARFLAARLGPKAAEDEDDLRPLGEAGAGGLTLRAMLPNTIT